MKRGNVLLFCITIFINIISGYKCALYLLTDPHFRGTEYGPFDVGSWSYSGHFPNDAISSYFLHAAGYTCTVDVYKNGCGSGWMSNSITQPYGDVSFDPWLGGPSGDNQASCFRVTAVATPNPTNRPTSQTNIPSETPTKTPTDAPTESPSTAPTSSCFDYNNGTSADGNDEIRQFDDKHITNIDNYFMNDTVVSEFNSSHDNYQHKLIECVGSDCIIQCHESASCLET
eukprot:44773_1